MSNGELLIGKLTAPSIIVVFEKEVPRNLISRAFSQGYKAPTEDVTKKSKLKLFQCKVK